MALDITIIFDPSVDNAPAGFKLAVQSVVNYIKSNFVDSVSLTIHVGWGDVDGQPVSAGALAQSSSVVAQLSYSQLVNSLGADAKTAADASANASLPPTSPVTGRYLVTQAEAKALGLSGNFSSTDGAIGFNSSTAFDFDRSDGISAGQFDFFGAFEHEFSEIMGRTLEVGADEGSGPSYFTYDLFHYSSAGVRQFVGSQPGYFSIDGGSTSLNAFNTNPAGDFGDWASSAGNDADNAFARRGVVNPVSRADFTALDVIGWDLIKPPAHDYGADGKSDVLWQKSDGTVVIWQMNSAGAIGSNTNLGVVDPKIWSLSSIGDYNGDGKADILLRNANGTVADWLMNGAGIAGSNTLGTMDSSWSIKGSGDFGGDGPADILWQNANGTVVIWQMNSSGTVASSTSLGFVSSSLSSIGDYNGDGKADVLLRNPDGTVGDWLMNGATIAGSNNLGVMDSSWSVKGSGDFGGDGKTDVLWQKSDGTVVIWQMNGAGGIASSTNLGVVDPAVWSLSIDGDYNGDGKADVLLRNANGTVADWLMNGAAITASNTLGTMDNSWLAIPGVRRTMDDFGGDGRADILWQRSDGTVVIWGMDAAGRMSSSTGLGAVGSSLSSIGDYNGDGKADVLLRNPDGAVGDWLMDGPVITGSNNLGIMDSSWSVRGSGDFSGDGKSDVLWQKSDGTVVIWQTNSSGGIASNTNLGAVNPAVWSLSNVGDYNGDSKADILLRNANGTVFDWLMDGAVITGSNSLGTMDSSWSVKGSGDFGGDGKSDILWQKSDGTVVMWQMDGAGMIGSSTNLGVVDPTMWSLSDVADYNGDGKSDVLLRHVNGTVADWVMNGATIAGSNTLGTMNNSWTVITR